MPDAVQVRYKLYSMKETILWYTWDECSKIPELPGYMRDLLEELSRSLIYIHVCNFEKLALEVDCNQVRVRDLDLDECTTPWIKVVDAGERVRTCTQRKKELISSLDDEDTELVLTFMGMDPFKYWTKQSLVRAIASSELAKEFDEQYIKDLETKILLTEVY